MKGHKGSSSGSGADAQMKSRQGSFSGAGAQFDSPNCNENKRDPESFARRYQLEILERAKEQNTIAYLDTGAGKTLIAVMLIKSYAHLLRKPKQNIALVLVPTVVLVQQQADVLEVHTDLAIGRFWGAMGVDRWKHAQWREQLSRYEVLVLTPQIFLDNLRHCMMKLEMVKLIVFDECHHARKDHPYACIMKEFYHKLAKKNAGELPKVFGMTASPVFSKGSSSHISCASEIKELEAILDSKVYALEDMSELEAVLVYPELKRQYYDDTTISHDLQCLEKRLEDVKEKHNLFVEKHSGKFNAIEVEKAQKKIRQLHLTLLFCLKEMGAWCATKASEILLKEEEAQFVSNPAQCFLINERRDFLKDAKKAFVQFLPSDKLWRCGADLEQNVNAGYLSSKIHCLIKALLGYRDVTHIRCIIFVERVISAMVLGELLGCIDSLSYLKFKYLAGFEAGLNPQSRNEQHKIICEFRQGKVNALIATSVLEEGLDVQGCNLVVRFDLPKTLCSYIQSRGRGRMQGSHYFVLIKRGDVLQQKQLDKLIVGEGIMRAEAVNRNLVSIDTKDAMAPEHMYRVESTGATATLNSSIALIHYYCSQLPGDRYYAPRPYFHIRKESECCILELPTNSPVSSIKVVGNVAILRKLACLEACKKLHAARALTDYLLPQEEEDEEENEKEFENETLGDKVTHPLYLPNILAGDWVLSGEVIFHCYCISFQGDFPSDMTPRNILLLVRHAFPPDVANMSVGLQTNIGVATTQTRSVGNLKLNRNQVEAARKFQVIIFSVLKYRKLEKTRQLLDLSKQISGLTSPMYLLLPLRNSVKSQVLISMINWPCIENVTLEGCDRKYEEQFVECYNVREKNLGSMLKFASGPFPVNLLQNSIVQTTHNEDFYCISHILKNLNSKSPFPTDEGNERKFDTYTDFFKTRHGRNLQYQEQPLLCARHLFGIHNLLHKNDQKETGLARKSTVELPAELCKIILRGIAMDMLFTFSLLPSFMHRLESMLAAAQLQKEFPMEQSFNSTGNTIKVLEALTRKSCQESMSLETLETLGDSFLKYVTSRHLYIEYPHYHEGQLTSKRMRIISNYALYKVGCDHKIPGYIRYEQFNPKEWIIPGQAVVSPSTNPLDTSHSTENLYIKESRSMKIKAVADVVEALIGMHLEIGGQVEAVNFMKWLGIKLEFAPKISALNGLRRLQMSTVNVNIPSLESLLKYKFHDPLLLIEALTHASYRDPNISSCYQRLEFLGDALLDYVITSYLYKRHPRLSPGVLTDMRSAAVNNECYAQTAVKWKLQCHLQYASHELHQQITEFVQAIQNTSFSGERCFGWSLTDLNVPKVLGDLIESIAGAILVDSGFDTEIVWKAMQPLLEPIVTPETVPYHPVRELSELCAKNAYEQYFRYDVSEGNHLCTVEVGSGKDQHIENASGSNKKTAKKHAAAKALKYFKARNSTLVKA